MFASAFEHYSNGVLRKINSPFKMGGGEMPPSSLVFARGYAIAYEFAYAKAFQ